MMNIIEAVTRLKKFQGMYGKQAGISRPCFQYGVKKLYKYCFTGDKLEPHFVEYKNNGDVLYLHDMQDGQFIKLFPLKIEQDDILACDWEFLEEKS